MYDIDALAAQICKAHEEKGFVTEKELVKEMKGLGLDDPRWKADLMDAVEALGFEIKDEFNENTDYDDGLAMDGISLYMADVGRYRLLSKEEEYDLAVRARHGDKKAKEKLITSNLRLVISIAKRYSYSPRAELQDLMQSGNLGLMKAADRYDPGVGCKFSSYATWWIKQAVTRYISDYCNTVRLPVYLCDAHRDISQFISQYQKEHGKEPSDKVLARKFGFSEEIIAAYRRVKRGMESLDAFPGEDYESDIGSYLADSGIDVEEIVISRNMKEDLEKAIDSV